MHDPLALPQESVGDHYLVGHERIRGEVFEIQRAEEKVSGREVGILRLNPALENDAAAVSAFLEWATLASRWQVRNALAVHGIARDFGGVYLVCEWPSGGTLADRLGTATVAESELAPLRASIANTLEDAAKFGVAHGRIVPEEILLCGDGSPRLAVFGIGLADDEMSTLLVDENGAPVRRLSVSVEDDAKRLAMLGKTPARDDSRRGAKPDHLATRTAPARGGESDDSTERGGFPWRPLAEQYRIEGELGAGGMGSVFRALELATGRVVAVKRMKNADPSAIKRFRREASAIARLNHPHVLQLMQAARDDDGDYLVLECAPNGSLADRLKKDGKLPEREVLAIARKIGAALEYAHGKGCIHRDVKPHNILLSESNEPKLADFGLARALDDVTLTTSSAGAGSPVYMPPEQWQDGKKADARSDVYAFAKTLYHLQTGEKPATIDRRLVPPALHAVLKRATEQEPEDRYDSIAAFVADFERAMGEKQTTMHGAAPGAARRLAWTVGVVLLVLGGAGFTLRDHPSIARLLGRTAKPSVEPTLVTLPDQKPVTIDPLDVRGAGTTDRSPVNAPIARFDDFVGRPLANWDEVRAALAAAPHYGGLALAPQDGLAPLRVDAISKFLEFVHLGSGSAPEFQGSGRYAITDEVGIVLVLVPGGEFEMGAQKRSANEPMFDESAQDDESPVTRITLAPYFLGKYEITQAQWTRLAGDNPSRAKPGSLDGADFTLLHPVENVPFTAARDVLERVALTLPTEAQWEYACRAGTRTSWFCGPRAEMLERYANLADVRTRDLNPDAFAHLEPDRFAPYSDPHANTSPIHAHAGNAFGFHDLSGNVAEWCLDGYGAYSIAARPVDGGRGVDAPGNRVVRGGSFAFGPAEARSAARAQAAPELTRPFIGVRAARRIDR